MRNTFPALVKNLFLKQPTFTVFFVTHRCNLNCKMCFYTGRPAGNELTLDEIRGLAKSLPPQWFMMLTGGEPFLRSDIVDIAAAFYDQGTMNLHFSTNGTLTDLTLASVRKIAAYARHSRVLVVTSIDGPKDLHDAIRRKAGAFDQTVSTTRELVKMKKDYSNLGVAVNMTLSAYNQHCWKETIDFIRRDLHVDATNIGLTRGETSDPESKQYDLENYWKAHRYLIQANRRDYLSPLLRVLALFKDVAQIENIYKIATGHPPPYYRCMAGRVFNVITEDGDVYPCEMLHQKMGNLRDVNMDFQQIWKSAPAKAVRRYIAARKCLCTYECAMTASLAASGGTCGQFLDFILHYRKKTREYYHA
ncbi:MAG: radical SAM protein [Kiritimatiellae bacterium]|nr:radical SAM protein [Kiritimatiellia bacterium]